MSNEEALNEIRAHERECTVRYENIERRLEEGSDKFKRIETLITGLYGLIVTGGLAIFGVVAALAFRVS